MSESTRHLVAYHNSPRMGRSLTEGNPFRVLTKKSVAGLDQNLVWFVVKEDSKDPRFHLGSVFRVSETGDTDADGFKHFAAGTAGHVFNPSVPLNDLEWFPAFFQSVGHFGLGIVPISDEQQIEGLKAIANRQGIDVAQL